jgi:hypothetical protein
MIYTVYFIQAGKNGSPVKIGVTSDLDERMRTLQTANPYPLTCKAAIPCFDKAVAYKLESYLHRSLHKHRMQGEWFKNNFGNLKKLVAKYEAMKHESFPVIATDFKDNKERLVCDLQKENKKLRYENKKLNDEIEQMLDEQILSGLE